MTSLFPHFVDAQQSAMRGLHIFWHIDQDGEIASGPYRGRNECVISIGQSPNGAPAAVEFGPSTSLSQGPRQRGIGAALVSGDLVAQRGPLLDQEVHSCDDDRQSN